MLDFLTNTDETKGNVYCATCKHFHPTRRSSYGGFYGDCPFSKLKQERKASFRKCKKHYEVNGLKPNQMMVDENFVDMLPIEFGGTGMNNPKVKKGDK